MVGFATTDTGARVAAMSDPPSKPDYRSLRQRDHTHGRALRGVADRLLRILLAMLNKRNLFDSFEASRRRPALSEKGVRPS
jgi:hypothetical protein